MPDTNEPVLVRFKFQGYNRHGARVWQTVEAPTVDVAKRLLREQGYRIERIWQAFDWRRSPLVWLGVLIVAAALGVAFVWQPLVGVAGTIVLVLVAAAVLERVRREHFDAQRKRLQLAAVQSQRAHLAWMEERRKREEVLLDLSVQRIGQQLQQRRQEEEATLIRLEATEATLPDMQQRGELRRELERKRAEIVRLEAELRRLEAESRG
jgi:apolipoprotein N-acyltransferase